MPEFSAKLPVPVHVIVPPTSYRARYLAAVVELLGKPVLWRMKGPLAYDCSGSVTGPLKAIGGPDLTLIENSQGLHDHSRKLRSELGPSERPLPGDLVFYGTGDTGIVHVATVDENGTGVISADGATSHIDPKVLGLDRALGIALANSANRVRRHAKIDFRKDLPFHVVHRNTFVDDLDRVTR